MEYLVICKRITFSINLVLFDHPSSKKCGDVCTYYKSYLPLKVIDTNYLSECVQFELTIGGKLCNFVALCRFPSQSQDQCEFFKEKLKLNFGSATQNNPFLDEVFGDFNA